VARANANCSSKFPQSVFQIRIGDWFQTTRSTCWSEAVTRICPFVRPLCWTKCDDHVLVHSSQGDIEVKELQHIPLSWVN